MNDPAIFEAMRRIDAMCGFIWGVLFVTGIGLGVWLFVILRGDDE